MDLIVCHDLGKRLELGSGVGLELGFSGKLGLGLEVTKQRQVTGQ